MKLPEKLYVAVCDEWTGTRYNRSNVGIYSDRDTGNLAASHMQTLCYRTLATLSTVYLHGYKYQNCRGMQVLS